MNIVLNEFLVERIKKRIGSDKEEAVRAYALLTLEEVLHKLER